MNKIEKDAQVIESASELFKKKLTEWYQDPSKDQSAYDYEKSFADALQRIEREVFEILLEKEEINQEKQNNSKIL